MTPLQTDRDCPPQDPTPITEVERSDLLEGLEIAERIISEECTFMEQQCLRRARRAAQKLLGPTESDP